MDEQKRKENNKRMLKVVAVAGGSALLIIIAFLMITIGAEAISDYKLSKEEDHAEKEQARDFIKALKYIANNEYKENIGVDNAYNYVNGISSIEFTTNSLSYRAYAQKGQLPAKIVSIKLDYDYGTVDNCISTINSKYKDITTFTLHQSIYEEVDGGDAKAKVVEYLKSFPGAGYVDNNPFVNKCYKSANPDETYLSFTYKDSNNVFYSFNELTYKSTTSTFEKDGTYSIDINTNKVMYYVFDEITK